MKETQTLTRVGPGTPTGDFIREYWVPAALSSEVEADGSPLRVKLLGEELIAFRTESGKLGLLGVPTFMFQEGLEPSATRAFKQIAKLTNGAYCSFNSSSAKQLRELLSAVAVYAAGGRMALEDYGKRTGGAARASTLR